jgi:hypothetical protein
MMDEWIDVNESAKITGYHPEHIRRLIREGKIQAKKFNIIWMVSKNSCLAYLDLHIKRDNNPSEL